MSSTASMTAVLGLRITGVAMQGDVVDDEIGAGGTSGLSVTAGSIVSWNCGRRSLPLFF